MLYDYDGSLTFLREDIIKYSISHNSQPLVDKNINSVITLNYDFTLTFYLIESSEIESYINIDFLDIYLNIIELLGFGRKNYSKTNLYTQRYEIVNFQSLFINTNENKDNVDFVLYLVLKDKTNKSNPFSFVEIQFKDITLYSLDNSTNNITTPSKKYLLKLGSDYKINTYKEYPYLYRTSNVILGHLLNRIYNYIDNTETIKINDGLTLIETDNPNNIAGKLIRLLKIKNTDKWFFEGLEFPQFDLKTSIKDLEVIGKVPSEKEIKNYNVDFSTGMFLYQS